VDFLVDVDGKPKVTIITRQKPHNTVAELVESAVQSAADVKLV